MLPYLKNKRVYLKKNSEYDENWVQDRIAEDPSILDLGKLGLLQRERSQRSAGRLDLLLSDGEQSRYEVELQLGSVDESHIIRTIEYWDIERKRYPQYDHTAVLVAEDVTSRFLNVIGLFNGVIPLILIQMQALEVGEHLTLIFTKVLDKLTLGTIDEDEEAPPTNRAYWENKGTEQTVAMADEMLEIAREFDPTFELNYKQTYIGLARDGRSFNFMYFIPQRKDMKLRVRIRESEGIDGEVDSSNLDVLERTEKSYYIRLNGAVMLTDREILKKLAKLAFDERNR